MITISKSFEGHLDSNSKVFFSGKFGEGKSHFLNEFFKEKEGQFNVFKVFPVHYSISHNEDIFQYIKAEILFELLKRKVVFDQETFSRLQTAQQFFLNQTPLVFVPFITALSKTGKSIYDVIEPFKKLYDEYEIFHKKIQIDDNKKVFKFLESIVSKSGSIFENDFYTEIIRDQLEKLKSNDTESNNSKLNVLIIEDLDRIDPDHIFRILNVFAAHLDGYFLGNVKDERLNKFGFDKIILVGDINNIREIYKHRYGARVDFNGYINKYFDTTPFEFDSKKYQMSIVTKFKYFKNEDHAIYSYNVLIHRCLEMVFIDFVNDNSISTRDLLKIDKTKIKDSISLFFNISLSLDLRRFGHEFVFYLVLNFLLFYFEFNDLFEKLTKSKDSLEDNNAGINYDFYIDYAIPFLLLESEYLGSSTLLDININKRLFVVEINVEEKRGKSLFKVINKKTTECIDNEVVECNKKDFYEVLIQSLEKLKSIKPNN